MGPKVAFTKKNRSKNKQKQKDSQTDKTTNQLGAEGLGKQMGLEGPFEGVKLVPV